MSDDTTPRSVPTDEPKPHVKLPRGRFDEGQAADATLDAEEGVRGRFDEGQATDDAPGHPLT
jgi:hypothetical protein